MSIASIALAFLSTYVRNKMNIIEQSFVFCNVDRASDIWWLIILVEHLITLYGNIYTYDELILFDLCVSLCVIARWNRSITTWRMEDTACSQQQRRTHRQHACPTEIRRQQSRLIAFVDFQMQIKKVCYKEQKTLTSKGHICYLQSFYSEKIKRDVFIGDCNNIFDLQESSVLFNYFFTENLSIMKVGK